VADGLAGLAEQLINRLIKPLDLVLLSRERIQETLDEAAERGRMTRRDANELVSELFRRGREQTDELLGQLGRAAGRARRTVGGRTLAIDNYDELTASEPPAHVWRRRICADASSSDARAALLRHASCVLASLDPALASRTRGVRSQTLQLPS
jgi:hypothetical protein